MRQFAKDVTCQRASGIQGCYILPEYLSTEHSRLTGVASAEHPNKKMEMKFQEIIASNKTSNHI